MLNSFSGQESENKMGAQLKCSWSGFKVQAFNHIGLFSIVPSFLWLLLENELEIAASILAQGENLFCHPLSSYCHSDRKLISAPSLCLRFCSRGSCWEEGKLKTFEKFLVRFREKNGECRSVGWGLGRILFQWKGV